MDSLITAAARALAQGDPLAALKRIALREDAPALALRGTAMAQLGDLARARELLRRAARAYGPREGLARARCLVAEAEVALATRDLAWSPKALVAARNTLEAHRDRTNAAHARVLEIRRLLLLGHLREAEARLRELDADQLPPPLRATHELAVAGIAVRRIQGLAARKAFTLAAIAAREAGIPALASEVASAAQVLATPAARLLGGGSDRTLLLEEVELLLASSTLVVDACRYGVRQASSVVELARRPVLFTLARLLAQAWPDDVSRTELVTRAFRARQADETYRARLRVEMGRLRRALQPLADVVATRQGFALAPLHAHEVRVLAPLEEAEHAEVLALLADGEAWSSSALALALGSSARTAQRALEALAGSGRVQPLGRGRARRYMTPSPTGIATGLLLPRQLANG